jgi:hypothetical protein
MVACAGVQQIEALCQKIGLSLNFDFFTWRLRFMEFFTPEWIRFSRWLHVERYVRTSNKRDMTVSSGLECVRTRA